MPASGKRFEDKVAIVTGGGSGIGRASASALAREGASVMLGGYEEGPLSDTVGDLRSSGASVTALQVDVSRVSDAEALVAATIEEFGRIDVLVNCAGTSTVGNIADMEEGEWDRVFGVNVKGVFLMSRAAIPHLIKAGGGAIVNFGSQLAIAAVGGFGAYCASKAAVVHLTRSMALELIPQGIRVNAVCPGAVDTPLLARAFPGGQGPQGTLQDLIAAHPIGRLGTPEEIAAAVLFLASDEASFLVGSVLVADGGYVLP